VTRPPPPTLYHYTCNHGHRALSAGGQVKPPALFLSQRQLALADTAFMVLTQLAWFTDLAQPQPDALGLTRHSIHCDRTAYRWQVADGLEHRVLPIRYGVLRGTLPRLIRDSLELAHGAQPRHWWVSGWAVPVTYAPARIGATTAV
jgi:hypothetical protein